MEKNEKSQPAAPPEETEPAPKPRSSSLNKILIIAGLLTVQAIAAFFIQKTLFFNSVQATTAEDSSHEKDEAKDDEHKSESEILMLDEIIVNPAGTSGRRYLAISIGVQTSTPEAEAKIEKSKPLVRDALISLLSAKQLDQLANVSYRDTLRAEVKEAIARYTKDVTVDGVVFTGYVLQ